MRAAGHEPCVVLQTSPERRCRQERRPVGERRGDGNGGCRDRRESELSPSRRRSRQRGCLTLELREQARWRRPGPKPLQWQRLGCPLAKAFISYKSNSQPDDQLAGFFADYLAARRHDIFIQTKIVPGQTWPEVVDARLKEADYLILLLSEQAVASEMVIEEIRRGVRYREANGHPRILPVRLGAKVDLPYDVGARVNRVQAFKWLSAGNEQAIAASMHDILSAGLPEQEDAAPATAKAEALSADGAATALGQHISCPRPSFDVSSLKDLNAQGGPVRLESPFYVSRPQDETCKQRIAEKGRTLLIRGSRQIGKTSLVARLYQHALDHKVRCVYLDFRAFGSAQMKDLDTLLAGIGNQIFDDLNPNNPPGAVWTMNRSAGQNLTRYLQTEIIGNRAEPLVIFMEVDPLFGFPAYSDDFFALVRSWHERRAFDSRLAWLNLVLAYSTETSMFIKTQHQSPFNVGDVFELADFSRAQFADLNAKHGSPVKNDSEIDSLMALLGGHPFLVRQSLYELTIGQTSVADLIARAANDDGPFSGHLQAYVLRFHENEDLKQPMKSVLLNGVCPDDISFYRLRSLGLVRGPVRTNAKPRCGLYAQYFGAHL
jgi:AAA domain-containing protein/TIR domain-containing protein